MEHRIYSGGKTFVWKGLLTAVILSGFWIYFAVDYIRVSGWWSNRSDLSLIEFIAVLGSFFAPVVLFFLAGGYIDRVVQEQKNNTRIQGYLNELIYPTSDSPEYTRQLTDELRTQISEFKNVYNGLSEETTRIRDDLKQWVSDLSQVISQIDAQTITSVKLISEHIHNLTEVTHNANEQTQQSSDLFSEQAVILQRVTQKTVDTISSLLQDVSQQTNISQQVLSDTQKACSEIKDTTDQIKETSDLLSGQNSRVSELISQFDEEAKVQNAHLFGNLEKVLSVFKAHGQMLDEEVGNSLSRLEDMQNALHQKTAEVLQATKIGIMQLETAGQSFVDKTTLLKTHTHQASELLKNIDCSPLQEPSVSSQSQKQTIKNSDGYLRDATIILQELQKISVDLTQLFSPKIQEGLWDKYYGGDKSVFMRYITNQLSDKKRKKISELYQTNGSFQKTVLNYMTAFEKMTKTLSQSESSELLMASVIGSDTGRLYMLLADMLKKEAKNAS